MYSDSDTVHNSIAIADEYTLCYTVENVFSGGFFVCVYEPSSAIHLADSHPIGNVVINPNYNVLPTGNVSASRTHDVANSACDNNDVASVLSFLCLCVSHFVCFRRFRYP